MKELLFPYFTSPIQLIYLIQVILHVNLKGLQGLKCLSCSAAVSPIDCDTVKLCGPHETCFMDVSVSDSGIIRYQLGCKDSQQCSEHNGKRSVITEFFVQKYMNMKSKNNSGLIHHPAYFNQRRSQGLLVCSECCSSTLCNSAGCGHTGYQPHRGPVCFNCPLQKSPGDCDTITLCGRDQVCMLTRTNSTVTHQDMYQTKCEERMACNNTKSFSIIGNRQINDGNCGAHCCNTDLCNSECSATFAPSVFPLTSPLPVTIFDPCITNPCARGICSPYLNTYNCTCEAGYTGRNCDVGFVPETTSLMPQSTFGLDPCVSSPCVWGKCDPYQSTYSCLCQNGYYGRNCELTSGKTTCNDGWLPFKGSCYKFGHNAVDFMEAEQFCRQNENSHLVHVNNKLENDFIKDKLREFSAKNWWLGATDEDIEGDWKWVDNDDRVNFTDWYLGQAVSGAYDCGVFWSAIDFKWDSYLCTAQLYPVCETTGSQCGETQIVG